MREVLSNLVKNAQFRGIHTPQQNSAVMVAINLLVGPACIPACRFRNAAAALRAAYNNSIG
jgi:hypothetical protein